MNYAYCPTCRAEVQDTGGFCLLGHRIGAPVASLSELRAEVDSAFDAARSRVAEVLRTPPPAPPRIPPPSNPVIPLSEATVPEPGAPPPVATGAAGEPSPGRARHLAPDRSEGAFFAAGGGAHSSGEIPVVRVPAEEPPQASDAPAPTSDAADLPTARGVEKVWGAISGDRPADDPRHDPITAFAPVPSMDWGPERPIARRRGRKDK